jgi:hypothetical protein
MTSGVTQTVHLRLNVPDDRKSNLHAANNKSQYCVNRTADWACRCPNEGCVISKSEAAIYYDFPEATDSLRANPVQKGIRRATDSIGNCVLLRVLIKYKYV